jgi:acetyl esterase/lipase
MNRYSWMCASVICIQLVTASSPFAQTNRQLDAKQDSPPPAMADLDRLIALYAPLQETRPYKGIEIARDLQYGPSERNLLDIFKPMTPNGALRPVLLFVHGDGFTGGERQFPRGLPFYDNIAVWAVRHGFVGVNMTYRLAPQFTWPAGAEDVASAIRYLVDEIASHGGDPNSIYVMGHSAGAVHVATYLAHPELQGSKGVGVAGAILVSGAFDMASLPIGDREKAYFGADTSKYANRSSLRGLVTSGTRLLVVNAEHDPPMFLRQADELREVLDQANKQSVPMLRLDGHSHMSTVMAINTDDTALSRAIEAFITDKSKD